MAIELGERERSGIAAAQHALRPRCEGVRWVPPPQLHLTVKFLGDVGDRNVPGVVDAVMRAAAESPPFEMELSGCGCFPPGGPVRIVWVGGSEPSGALNHCVERVERELEPLGFPRERRPFSPHLTMGRVREDRTNGRLRSAVEAQKFAATPVSVSSVTVMSSVLSPRGPTYAPVATIPLGRAEQP